MFTTLVASLLSLGQAGPGGDPTIVIPGRAPIVQALFNPDGRRLYFATLAGVEGHDIESGKRLFDAPYGRQLVCRPKGDLLAVVRIDVGMVAIGGSIAVLDAGSGKTLHLVTGTSAAFSPDSRWLISHSTYTWGHPKTDPPPKVQITDLGSGKTHLAQLPGIKSLSPDFRNASGGRPFHFTKDGKTLVLRSVNESGQHKSLAACDLETGKSLETLPKDEDLQLVRDASYSADGKRFAHFWNVFDVERGKTIAKLEAPKHAKTSGWYPAVQLSPDGKSVFGSTAGGREAAGDEKTGRLTLTLTGHLHVWDADTGKWKQVLAEARRVVTAPTVTLKKSGGFPRDNPRFAVNDQGTRAVDYDALAVTVWDLAAGKPLRKLRSAGPTEQPEILRFSSDGKWIASAGTGGEVALWDARTGQPGRPLDRAAHLGDVCFRPKSDELVGAGHGLVYVWDLKTGELKRTFEHPGYHLRVECHPDGKLAAVSDHRGDAITLIDLESGKTGHRLSGRAKSLAFHPDGGALLALDPYGTVTLWDTASGKRLRHWPSGKSADSRHAAQRIAFLPSAARFLLCENDAVAVVDAATGKRLRQHSLMNEARRPPTDADVHPDGKRFVVAFAGEQAVEERDLETGKVLRSYPGFPHGTSQARYSPDGSRLATAGAYVYELRIHSVPTRLGD